MKSHLLKDTLIFLICVIITLSLVKSGMLDSFLANAHSWGLVGAFMAGIFFTSVFTLTASTILFVELLKANPLPEIAIVGALGAVVGDLVLFLFVKNRVSEDVDEMIMKAGMRPHYLIKAEFLRWLNPILGAVIIASPFPDELGLALLGFSKTRTKALICISFVMNMVGIYFVWLAMNAL